MTPTFNDCSILFLGFAKQMSIRHRLDECEVNKFSPSELRQGEIKQKSGFDQPVERDPV